ncbi:MAG: ferric reductase-like transmembrane domain-containing protein [Alphaproteobacteria bacterium]|uniref:Rieske 2Fe-2S domain-containing protein n=1 Tax=Rhizobium sp. R86522 TaxID=3093861 RepID=UPI00367325E0|nr:ferric reductase-like transmembrane domain-containing protein [Alphaproteobacteria bacterium]
MSTAYKPVGWNRNKLIYDAVLLAGVVVYILLYLKLAPLLSPSVRAVDTPILRMRAFGSLAFLLLTIVLAMGPLARLDPRFLPLLYNRRHFGVLTAAVAFTHAMFVLDWYFAFSATPKLTALFTSNTSFGSLAGFPFEVFGVFALVILIVLAATSHDFWLSFLSPAVWKAIHMSVYAAYAAVVLHVGLGAVIGGSSPMAAVFLGASLVALSVLHLLAGRREKVIDEAAPRIEAETGWVDVGDLHGIEEGRAIIGVLPQGERVAVFRFKGRLSALSNLCSHQNGPIGEGKIVLGFATCPWHGYQYRLEDGCAPPPFRERVRKYRMKVVGTRVLVDPVAVPLGTRIEPFTIAEAPSASPPPTSRPTRTSP